MQGEQGQVSLILVVKAVVNSKVTLIETLAMTRVTSPLHQQWSLRTSSSLLTEVCYRSQSMRGNSLTKVSHIARLIEPRSEDRSIRRLWQSKRGLRKKWEHWLTRARFITIRRGPEITTYHQVSENCLHQESKIKPLAQTMCLTRNLRFQSECQSMKPECMRQTGKPISLIKDQILHR